MCTSEPSGLLSSCYRWPMGRPGPARHDVGLARPKKASGRHGPCLYGLRAWPQAQARPCGPFFVPCWPVKHGPIHGPCQPMAHNAQNTSNTLNFFTFTITQQFKREHIHSHIHSHNTSQEIARIYQNELMCNDASLKTFLGKTHPCEKP